MEDVYRATCNSCMEAWTRAFVFMLKKNIWISKSAAPFCLFSQGSLMFPKAKGFFGGADFLNLKLSGPIRLPLCDVIIIVQSILCSVTPFIFAGLRFLWEHI